MIHVTRKEMENAFDSHRKRYQKNNPTITDKMVLFYAVESGLKALFMRNHNLERTNTKDQNGDSVEKFSHDLNKLLRKIRSFSVYKVPEMSAKDSIRSSKTFQISAKSLHEAWRYGKMYIEACSEQRCLEELDKILQELKYHLRMKG